MKVELKELEALTTKAIKKYGYNDRETATIREMLLYAQLRGNNQGVVKLIGKGIPKDPKAGGVVIEKETALSAKINEEIFVPGERGNRQAAAIRASGMIEVEDHLLEELRKVTG